MFSLPSPLTHLGLILSLTLVSCSSSNPPPSSSESSSGASSGQLILVANGEDFIRQGFVSKDGWQIEFDHAYVNLSNVNAYQTDPPFDPHQKGALKPTETVNLLEKPQPIDLAEGDATAAPIVVQTVPAPSGNYNSLSWQVVKGNEGEMTDSTIVLVGKATKDGKTVDFTLKLQEELNYVCGEFIGEERKGFLAENGTTEIETTFHFDHLFGDAETPPDDSLNVEALGFDTLANLAENGQLIIDQGTLEQKLSPSDSQKLQQAIVSLGHVGEGHCRFESVAS